MAAVEKSMAELIYRELHGKGASIVKKTKYTHTCASELSSDHVRLKVDASLSQTRR